jgi:small subunit ribosomal protein S8
MDPIANMLTIIKNGYLASKKEVSAPYSKIKEKIAKKIEDLGFLEGVRREENTLKMGLVYLDGEPVLRGIERVSKPSLRAYRQAQSIPKVLGGLGEVVLSTSKGVMTGAEAKKNRLGGEIILKIWR